MKKKSRKARLKRKKEFRFHKVKVTGKNKITEERHPAYVFLEKGNIYIYVSLTHSESIDNVLLVKLRKNPNPKDNRDSYWVVEIREDTKDRFGRRINGLKMDENDDKDIRETYDKNKNPNKGW